MDQTHDGPGLEDTLGGRMVAAREAGDLSTAQLARRIGVKTETLSAWETDRSEPRPNQLVTISGLLNVSPTWLLTGAGDSPPEGVPRTEMMHIRSVVARLRDQTLAIADELRQLDQRLASYQSFQE